MKFLMMSNARILQPCVGNSNIYVKILLPKTGGLIVIAVKHVTDVNGMCSIDTFYTQILLWRNSAVRAVTWGEGGGGIGWVTYS